MAGPGDTIRASDAERDAVIEMLRRHTADGRLTMSEFEERVAEALAARTRGDLDPVLRELPPLQPPAPLRTRRRGRGSTAAWIPRVALIVALIAFASLLVLQGAWWIVFPLLWVVGGCSRGGMACGSRHRSRGDLYSPRYHSPGSGYQTKHDKPGTIRV